MGLFHNHDHAPGHSHGHSHPAPAGSHGAAFALAVFLNLGFVAVEAAASFVSGSAALLADAGHNLGDVLALLLAWGASVLAARPASAGFTYGLKSSSILAALANAALLWVAIGVVLVETLRRFWQPEPVVAPLMIGVAAAGIAVNLCSALLFARGRHGDLNLRAAFQHLVADAAVSLGVVIAGVAILLTGWRWLDPVTSLVITVLLALGNWSLLKEAVRMGLLGVPGHIDGDAVRAFLAGQPGVAAVHDLHIWGMSTTESALTAHLVMPAGAPDPGFLDRLAHELEHRFAIHHPTIQIEPDGDGCHLHP